MINPAPSAALEGFGDSALLFGLYTFVPDPGLSGDVRHRLCTEIQRRFVEEGIVIPFPTHELHLNRVPTDLTRALETGADDPLAGAGPSLRPRRAHPTGPPCAGAAQEVEENPARAGDRESD